MLTIIKKTWVLIDEYDSAVNKGYLEFNDKNAKQTAELFRSVFEATLKGNKHLDKSVLTGVQYIVKSGMLSGLNNLSKYNIKSVKYSKYYGINQEEMSLLTEHFDINDTKAARIKHCGIAKEPNFQEGFKSYWEKSGSVSEFLNKLLKNQYLKATFEELVNGKNIFIGESKEDSEEDDFKQLKDMRDGMNNTDLQEYGLKLFYSYLFITGYLTHGGKSGELKFPNKEIQKEMSNYLKDY
eukprot:snap_masked-scaffold_31-processed-gene-3.10-mRNA-1 protein AED:1.00 eAED:1.00 QI:0/0/0/0/1/1/3/0/238